MENLLIHIGYHKTGTTWLQSQLFARRPDLFIPISAQSNSPKSFARHFIYDVHSELPNSFDDLEENIREEFAAIQRIIHVGAGQIGVISHERLSGSPSAGGFDAATIARRIHRTFPHAKILIVIREQTDWLLSNYFQYLELGGAANLQAYLCPPYDGKVPGFSFSHVAYHHLIRDYQQAFGKNQVCVMPYEWFREDKSLFLNKLGAFLEVDISSDGLSLEKVVNPQGNAWEVYTLRKLTRYLYSSSLNGYSNRAKVLPRLSILMLRRLVRLWSTSERNQRLKEAMRKEIVAWTAGRYEESNRITEELIDVNLAELGYSTGATV